MFISRLDALATFTNGWTHGAGNVQVALKSREAVTPNVQMAVYWGANYPLANMSNFHTDLRDSFILNWRICRWMDSILKMSGIDLRAWDLQLQQQFQLGRVRVRFWNGWWERNAKIVSGYFIMIFLTCVNIGFRWQSSQRDLYLQKNDGRVWKSGVPAGCVAHHSQMGHIHWVLSLNSCFKLDYGTLLCLSRYVMNLHSSASSYFEVYISLFYLSLVHSGIPIRVYIILLSINDWMNRISLMYM